MTVTTTRSRQQGLPPSHEYLLPHLFCDRPQLLNVVLCIHWLHGNALHSSSYSSEQQVAPKLASGEHIGWQPAALTSAVCHVSVSAGSLPFSSLLARACQAFRLSLKPEACRTAVHSPGKAACCCSARVGAHVLRIKAQHAASLAVNTRTQLRTDISARWCAQSHRSDLLPLQQSCVCKTVACSVSVGFWCRK
jgi:hypothetical protein